MKVSKAFLELSGSPISRYVRFGLVGITGLVVDMGILFLLADPKMLGFNLTLSKAIAGEFAIANNFVWNEIWTFGDRAAMHACWRARLIRFAKFNLICLVGIVLSISLLTVQVQWMRMDIYIANFIAIVITSIWNFSLNSKFGWKKVATE